MKLKNITKKNMKLLCGGKFKFNAVDKDERIAVNISTSCHKTASGNSGVGKINKIFKYIYFLLMANVERTAVIFTEKCLHENFVKEQENGRVYKKVELLCVPLADETQKKFRKSVTRYPTKILNSREFF